VTDAAAKAKAEAEVEATAAQAAAEQAEQQRLAAIPFTCCVCESVSDACLAALGEDDTERPRYCSKAMQKERLEGAPQGLREQAGRRRGGGAAAAPSE